MTLYEHIINEIAFDVSGNWRKNVFPAKLIKNTTELKTWRFTNDQGQEVMVTLKRAQSDDYWSITFTVDGEYYKDENAPKLNMKDFNRLMATVSNIVYVFLEKHEPKFMEWKIDGKTFVNYVKQFINGIHQSTTDPVAKKYTAKISTSIDQNDVEHGYFKLFHSDKY